MMFISKKYSIVVLLLLICSVELLHGQEVKKNDYDRYDFATMYLGIDLLGIPPDGDAFYLNGSGNTLQPKTIGSQLIPCILIGATHFWGHVDLFVNFPVTVFNLSDNDGFKASYQTGIETGVLLYPWPLRQGKFRPYIGASWSSVSYQQKVEANRKGPV